VHLVVSPHGRQLLADELDITEVSPASLLAEPSDRLTIHPFNDLASRLASGSFLCDGMVVCPCSSNTLGAIAAGLGSNLITRAAHVTLKENRKLILVPREMPLSLIELRNLVRLAEAGAVICPASPGLYLRPKTVEEMVDFVVGKILDLLGVDHDLETRWTPGQGK
jgi:4-hydroxy-3-polyprenylbenzoate decarboxylase